MHKFRIITTAFACLFLSQVLAQESMVSKLISSPVDSYYVKKYDDVLTTRLYLAQKYTRFNVVSNKISNLLDYKPNTDFIIGLGASYEYFTINIGIPVPAELNPTKEKGSSQYLDIQSSIYTSKIVFDLFGQFYKGMYLQNTNTYSSSVNDTYYIRPDIYTQLIGFTGYYVFNNKKFSYRAANIQNQRQMKSSGTGLLGIEVYHGLAKGDSAFIPDFVNSDSSNPTASLQKFKFFRIGPGGGYAHTFVFWKRFFFMISLTINIAFGSFTDYDEQNNKKSHFTIDPGIILKSALGYNSESWFFGISFSNNSIINLNSQSKFNSMFSTGNVRIMIAKRFGLSKKTKKSLDKVLPNL